MRADRAVRCRDCIPVLDPAQQIPLRVCDTPRVRRGLRFGVVRGVPSFPPPAIDIFSRGGETRNPLTFFVKRRDPRWSTRIDILVELGLGIGNLSLVSMNGNRKGRCDIEECAGCELEDDEDMYDQSMPNRRMTSPTSTGRSTSPTPTARAWWTTRLYLPTIARVRRRVFPLAMSWTAG